MKQKKQTFSNIELLELAFRSADFYELQSVAEHLQDIQDLGANLDLEYFKTCAHNRLNQIYSL